VAEQSDLRISDADREREASALREHYAAGRLDSSEFEERLQAVYGARTEGELATLRADLPALPPKPPTTRELVVQTLTQNVMARYVAAGGAAFIACTAVWAATGASSTFWPKWVLIFTAVTFLRGRRRGGRGRGAPPPGRGGGRGSGGGGRGSGGGGRGSGGGYSYHYEYRYGHGGHRHQHEQPPGGEE
jgi:hypothetical protein